MLIAFGNIARRFGVGRPPPSALGACGTSGRVRVCLSKSRGQVLWAFGFAGLGVLRRSTSSLTGRGPLARVAAHGRRPAYHELPRKLVAAGGNGFGLFSPLSRLIDLPLTATCCNHGALSEEGPRVKSSLLVH